jgi:hypothetical protein
MNALPFDVPKLLQLIAKRLQQAGLYVWAKTPTRCKPGAAPGELTHDITHYVLEGAPELSQHHADHGT